MRSPARRDIQGLRAVAVVLVILFHLPAAISLRGGFIGVDIFYVISGFVVTTMVIRPSAAPGGALREIGRFLRRRVMRLVPVLSVVVVATLAMSIVFAPTQELGQISWAGLSSQGFVSNFFYAVNFDTYWNPAVLRSPFLHTWSLGVEFQTYLLFPLLLLGVYRAGRATHRSLRDGVIVTSVLAAISLALFVYLLFRPGTFAGYNPQAVAFYTPVTRFWEFALGIIPALLASRGLWSERAPVRGASVVAWVLLAAGLLGSTLDPTLNPSVLLACLGAAIILANGARGPVEPPSFLAWRPLVWIGDRSYSIYLWHWPLLVLSLWLFPGNLAVAIGSIGVTIGLSILTYRFVEERFRRPPASPRVPALLPSAAFVTVGLLVGAVAVTTASSAWYLAPAPLSAAAVEFADDGPTGAEMDAAIAGCRIEPLQITCVNDPDAATVVVIGDSLGYRAIPAVQLAAQEHGLNATMMWTGGCGIEVDSCPSWIYDSLRNTDVAAIVIAMNFDRESDRVNGSELAAGRTPRCPTSEPTTECALHQQNVAAFTDDARAGLGQLETITDHILMALPFPQQSVLVEACLAPPLIDRMLSTVTAPSECGWTSRQWQAERQGLYPEAIIAATSGDPAVTVWDPVDALCDASRCPAVINGGEQIMEDAIHWSWEASRLLYPEFSGYLDTVAQN